MNTDHTKENRLFYLLYFLSLGIFFLGRLIGPYLFENNWPFTHWQYTPWWYFIIIAFFTLGLGYFIYQKSEWLDKLDSTLKLAATGIIIFLFFFIFQTDSFLYGGGNYLMGDLARFTAVIYNWYDSGLTLISKSLYAFFTMFGYETNSAAYYSWKVITFSGTILSIFIAFQISRLLVADRRSRVLLFLGLFLGVHSLVYFGLIGFQTIILAFVYLFIFYLVRLSKKYNQLDLLWLTLTTIAAVLFHPYLYILLPAYVMALILFLFKANPKISFSIGVVALIALLYIIYTTAISNFALAKHILFIEGNNINKAYNLLSPKHIADIIMLVLVFFPHVLMFKYLIFKQLGTIFNKPLLAGLFLLSITSNTVLVILEPINSMPLELPTYLIFLAPSSILLCVLSLEHKLSVGRLKAIALIVLIIPLSLWPVYNRLDYATDYFDEYMNKNPRFYIEGCTAIQDSYHYKRNIEVANKWYLALPKLSNDFMDLTVARENISGNREFLAISHLSKLKTKFPFMLEPHFLLANIYQQQRNFSLARGQIDTCLMLAPYDVEQLKLDYRFYRDIGDYLTGIEQAEHARELYPKEIEIKEDLAILHYRAGNYIIAEAMCDSLIFDNNNRPYPQLVKGFILEIKKDPVKAAQYYQKFLELAPNAGEFNLIQARLDSLMKVLEYER